VIESKDNWSYSRSLLFSWAIPLTHTGVRATYAFIDQLSLTLGYVNGWNMVNDNNIGKTFEGQLNGNPTSWLNILVNTYYGAETSGSNTGAKKYVADICSTVTWNTWKFGINYDSGRDEVGAGGTTDSWSGVAVYIKDQVVRWYAPSIRIEQFRDSKGGVTGFTLDNGQSVGGPTLAGKVYMWEGTLSNEIKINDNLLFRLEYRHDRASKTIFQEGNDVRGRHGQDTFAFEAIFMF
jgi:hypothetical protein